MLGYKTSKSMGMIIISMRSYLSKRFNKTPTLMLSNGSCGLHLGNLRLKLCNQSCLHFNCALLKINFTGMKIKITNQFKILLNQIVNAKLFSNNSMVLIAKFLNLL